MVSICKQIESFLRDTKHKRYDEEFYYNFDIYLDNKVMIRVKIEKLSKLNRAIGEDRRLPIASLTFYEYASARWFEFLHLEGEVNFRNDTLMLFDGRLLSIKRTWLVKIKGWKQKNDRKDKT